MTDNCLTRDNVQMFLGDQISENDRVLFESHLAGCAKCRREMAMLFNENIESIGSFAAPDFLVERVKSLATKGPGSDVKKTMAASGSTNVRRYWQVAFAASALVFIGFAGYYLFDNQPRNATETFRNGSSKANLPNIVSPVNNSEVSGDTIEFKWEPVPNGRTYTLMILDEKGDLIEQQSTNQASAAINTSKLAPTKHCFWFIKAKLADGTETNSDTSKFRFVK